MTGHVEDQTAAAHVPDEGHPDRSGRRWRRPAAIAAAVALAGLGVGLGLALSGGSSHPPSPEGVPIQNVPDLASADSTVGGAPVDGITCRKSMDQSEAYHVHALVDIFVDGQQMRIPAGAGIVPPRIAEPAPGGVFVDNSTGSCLYWLHTHANDGILHVEAPHRQAFTLGQFFDIWNQPLGANQVGPAKGAVTAFVDGRRFAGDPRDIPLNDLAVVQLDVGTPVVPFKPVHFKVTGACSTNCAPPPGQG